MGELVVQYVLVMNCVGFFQWCCGVRSMYEGCAIQLGWYGAWHLKSALIMGNSFCLSNIHKYWGLAKVTSKMTIHWYDNSEFYYLH